MVITCPSCSARYRLNPDKIKGRGAKITCPKCSHIFVVFSESGEHDVPDTSPPEAAASPPAAAKPAPAPPAPAPTAKPSPSIASSLARRDSDTTTGAFRAVGLNDDEMPASPTTTGKIRVVAPGPRKSRRTVATIDTNNNLEALSVSRPDVSAVAEGSEDSSPAYTGPEPTNASDLNFREVGITTWKVKVSIGLIYDFSDISTLKKYLADKKVTEDDLISHNAKEWVRIGEIENLDQHFIATWKAAKAAEGEKPKAKPKVKVDADSATGTGKFSSTQSGQRPTNPFAPPTATARPRRPKPPPVEERPNRTPIALVAVLLVGLGLIWFFVMRDSPLPTSQASGAGSALPAPKLDPSEEERIRDQVRRDVEQHRQDLIEQVRAEAATEDDDDTPQLEAVRPEGLRVPVVQRSGALPPPIRDVPRRGTGLSAPSATGGEQDAGTSTTTTTAKDRGGQMYFDKGKEALASGNFGSARSMFQRAVDKCPTCGEFWEGLGKAYQGLDEPEKAGEAFAKAQELGVSVNTARP